MPRKRLSVTLLVVLTLASSSSTVAQPVSKSGQIFFVLLRRPANPPQLSKDDGERLQEAHMANIRKLHAEHKLLVAGPFLDDTALRGIFVFQAESGAQVREWAETDPAIKAGRLAAEIHGPWLIDAGAIRDPRTTDGLQQYTLVMMTNGEKGNIDGAQLQKRHAAFVQEQTEKGHIAIAGDFPSGDAAGMNGVIIFCLKAEEATKLIDDDPLLKSGALRAEIHPWATVGGVLAPGPPLN